jgi:catalase (peroxidase I)
MGEWDSRWRKFWLSLAVHIWWLEFTRENTADLTPGPLDSSPRRLDTGWFVEILKCNPATGTTRLPSDFNMANDPTLRPIISSFANDPDEMFTALKSAH